jgi:hypothetical protein
MRAAADVRAAAPLVWRQRASRADEASTGASSHSDHRTPAVSQPAVARAESAPAASQLRVPTAREAAPALTFDGPALDRLAEDVMQRIDRRMRIERERRGL